MGEALFVDPALVIPSKESDATAKFWLRIAEWENLRNISLGYATFEAATEFYGNSLLPNPHAWIPSGMTKSVHRVFSRLLSRTGNAAAANPLAEGIRIIGNYIPNNFASLLTSDIAHHSDFPEVHMASDTTHWSPPHEIRLEISPGPPSVLNLYFDVDKPTKADALDLVHEYFKERSILIVGGQVEFRILERAHEICGIGADQIQWSASEKSKKAAGVESKIRGLSSSAIIVCLTGKIDHSTYYLMKKTCGRIGNTLHVVESPTGLIELLCSVAGINHELVALD
ncbi:hypothetical protein [Rhodococcus sp. 14-2483-1-1]|uniref:hypothetical protein n=1 Tax=Rhodococcus sp. 14-2483-1-1 TaxID=2023148 RepID=UPI0011405DB1|nr:hypothetical protein [Rhodococcus sp. 14-2483-1-1]